MNQIDSPVTVGAVHCRRFGGRASHPGVLRSLFLFGRRLRAHPSHHTVPLAGHRRGRHVCHHPGELPTTSDSLS